MLALKYAIVFFITFFVLKFLARGMVSSKGGTIGCGCLIILDVIAFLICAIIAVFTIRW